MDFVNIILFLLGRERCWRLSRSLYMRSRGEKRINIISKNGEAKLIGAIVNIAKDGDIFWDIGANVGEWTDEVLSSLAVGGKEISVDLFEPAPAAASLLAVKFSEQNNVRVHSVALSNHTGSSQFALAGETAGTNSLELQSVEQIIELIDVETITGSDMAERLKIDRVEFVKIDTEGHDFAVLTGLVPLILAGRIGIVQFEYNSRWLSARRSLRDVFKIAEISGYKLGRVGLEKIEIFDFWNPECDRFFEDNYVLIAPDKCRLLDIAPMRWSESNTLVPA